MAYDTSKAGRTGSDVSGGLRPFMGPEDQSDREETLVRDEASSGNTEWLPTYERPGSLVDIDDTWEY